MVVENKYEESGRRRDDSLWRMLTEDERHQLLVVWNATAADYAGDQSIHGLFEQQVECTPDAIALVFEQQRLSFQDLNRRANQLARYLQRLGVGPEALVGIGMERSPALVVGLLGILKAGGAYVPLDPAYPAERLAFMLGDSQPTVLLTQQHLLKRFPAYKPVVCLDTDWQAIARESEENISVGGENLLYALYTSGSTGQPKGVTGTHRAAINRFSWMWKTYPFEPGEVCCQKTSLSFVDSVWEIFGPLLQGICSVIIPDVVVRDAQQLLQTLAIHHVTRIVLVPSLLRVLLETTPNLQNLLPSLKYCVCSGEALPAELALRFQERMPHSILLNLYGSSEVAADVTCYDLRNYHTSLASIPIGRPIANTQIYVLDEQMQPVPIGVPGELYAGGDGLARGYLHRPELTAARFVPDPFSSKPGARLYKTGDWVRYLADGNIEYLGRLDHQVKLRGMRVELSEIESVLLRHPTVRQAVVMAHEDVSGDMRLVAYVVLREETATVDDLRNHILKHLPDYMVPSAFVILEALPLTPNGKIDRQALPAPDQARSELLPAFVAARTPLEETIASIWSELLEVAQVSIHDNFFALGGHSLLAMQVISRLRTIFQVEVPLQSFLDAPTVAQLATLLQHGQDGGVKSHKSPLRAVSREAYRVPTRQAGTIGRG